MPENIEIYFELDFGIIAAIALEYDFEIDAYEDDYAIFRSCSSQLLYVRVYWPDLKFMVYDEYGRLTWIDDRIIEMVDAMFALK